MVCFLVIETINSRKSFFAKLLNQTKLFILASAVLLNKQLLLKEKS
tara:strand:- start:13583 stop:13720 length:138 start_codon:yes stop_codon:yes gene_type:complete